MPLISVSITLLVILCALFFLSKIKDQNPGALIKWSAYLVFWMAISLLLFQVARGCSKMWHRKMCSNTECSADMHKSQMHSRSMGHGSSGEMSCKGHDGMENCCEGKMGKKRKRMKAEDGVVRESSVDTVDGNIIMKETEIIERHE